VLDDTLRYMNWVNDTSMYIRQFKNNNNMHYRIKPTALIIRAYIYYSPTTD